MFPVVLPYWLCDLYVPGIREAAMPIDTCTAESWDDGDATCLTYTVGSMFCAAH
jgi:hypothetical protein